MSPLAVVASELEELQAQSSSPTAIPRSMGG